MKGWLLRLWAKLLGYGDAFAVRGAPRRGRSGLHFEQLEDRTVPAAYLVRDIRVGLLTSWSRALNNVNGTLFFIANDGQHGYELWKSDGTSSGTVMVHDIRPGPASAFPPGGPYSQYSHGLHHPLGAEVNGTLFFVVNDGSNGYELWKSDGTSSGTVLVRDIRPGGHSAFLTRIPASLTNVNGTLFFVANDGQHGAELWKSDGTSSGTLLAWDIHPLSPGSFRFHDGLSFDGRPILANVEGVLFFSANNGSHGGELWRYAPLHGASLVRDTNPGSLGSYPYNLTNVNGTLFFTAYDRSHGSELWKSDGTASGTLLVRDIFPGVYPSNLRHFTDVNGTLFFTAWDGSTGFELWRSDGTATGTRLVADIVPGSASSGVSRLTNVNGTLFFQANDRSTGTELWKSDGTSTGTVLVRDINPGSYGSEPIRFANVNGTLFFTTFSWTAPYGRELWKSDGTSSGTVVVRDISPGHRGSYPYNLTNVNGTLFFTAADPVHGRELWATDFVSPTIVNFTLPPGGTYTAGQHLDFTVQFSETVVVNTSGNTARLELTIGTTTRFANYVSGSGTNTLLFRYTVQAGDLDTDGITLHSPLQLNGDTIRDNAGNDAVLTFTPPNTSGVLVDTVAPTIASVTPPNNGTYTAGQHLNFTVQFSETVVVNTTSGTPRLQLTIGSATRFATYQSGSGSATLVFRYTVQAGDLDTDGIALSSPMQLNGGTIRDNAGNDAVLTFTPPNTSGVLVDAVAPTIVSITPPANGTYIAGQTLDVLVQFSEGVVVGTTATSRPYVRLRIGTVIRNAEFLNQASPNTLRFRYVVQAGESDNNGVEILSPLVRPAGTFIRDPAGNPAGTTFTSPSTPNVRVDAVAPTIAAVTPPANRRYVTGQVLEFLVRFSEAVNVGTTATNRPHLRLRIGTVVRNAAFVNMANATTARFRYTIQASDRDTNGIEILAPLTLPTGTFIRDLAGNNANLTFVPPSTLGILVN